MKGMGGKNFVRELLIQTSALRNPNNNRSYILEGEAEASVDERARGADRGGQGGDGVRRPKVPPTHSHDLPFYSYYESDEFVDQFIHLSI